MNTTTKTWDLMGVQRLVDLVQEKVLLPRFNAGFRCSLCLGVGSYTIIISILSEEYKIPNPKIEPLPKTVVYRGMYDFQKKIVYLKKYTHLKTVLHEFYHHLDNMTDGLYDSSDNSGGSSSLAWQFAEHYVRQMKKVYNETSNFK